MLVCPVARRESRGWGIACNSEISGQVLAKLQAASQVPVAFDSTDLARGASASIDTLPAPGRHNSRGLGNNVSFADGSARFVRGSLQPAKKPGL
jgi:prepilin-type processing-associated H-X9-DG protein